MEQKYWSRTKCWYWNAVLFFLFKDKVRKLWFVIIPYTTKRFWSNFFARFLESYGVLSRFRVIAKKHEKNSGFNLSDNGRSFETNEFRLNIQTRTFFGAWCNELVLENVLFYFRHSLGWLVCTPWFQSQKPSNFASEM